MPLFPGLRVSQLNRLALAVFLVSMVTTSLWSQNTIRVPEDQPTIQDAIGIANSGDTILVAPGTYLENVFFFGTGFTVKSSAGPETTIIDGGGFQPTVAFQTGQGPATVLSGFTIRNGGTDGGVFVLFSSPTITNNIITNNTTCGIQLAFSPAAVVTNNTISNNPTACPAPFGGAGITIEGNGAPVISGNKIINNGSDNNFSDGGGIGVGAFSGSARAVISNNTIKGNRAQLGGGINVSLGANPVITQNLIVENVGSLGGGVAITSASGSLTSNTIANNNGVSLASGLYISDSPLAPLSLINNLIIGRSGSTALFCNTSSPDLALANNDVFALDGVAYDGPCAPPTPDPNFNISADPMFVDSSQANYRVQAGSPAIDKGANSAPNLLQNDFEGQLRILDGDENSTDVIDIGAYERALVVFSPSPLNFGSRPVGTSLTLPLTLSLKNRASTLTFQPLPELTGDTQDFAQANDCLDLAPGDSCTFNFTFTPQVLGSRTAVLKVSRLDGQALLPLAIVSVMGEGVAEDPAIELETTPASLDFATQLVGTTSAAQRVTLNAPPAFVVNQVTITGPFQHVLSCAVAPCHIDVTFTPTARGPASGLITIDSNAVGSPHTIPLSGVGTAPAASVSPTALDFGVQAVGSTSSQQSLTLTNDGNATLHISGISITGDFAHTTTCSGVLAAGANCFINVTFTPSAGGVRNGTLTISSDSDVLVPAVTLTGRGAVPVAVVTPASLSFGNQRLGVTSASQAVTLSNAGEVALHITQISKVGEFDQTNNCGAVLAPSTSCSIAVTFTPAVVGLRNGSVTISNNDPGAVSSVTVALSGTGVVPAASVSPSALDFGVQAVGSTSSQQTLALANNGNATLNISGISTTGDFARTTNCSGVLVAGASCLINVTFSPTLAGVRSGTLTITSDSETPLPVVTLVGRGAVPVAAVTPASLSFGNQRVGVTSASQTVTLSNTGEVALHITQISVSAEFAQTNNCGTVLAPSASCSIAVTFTPAAVSLRNGSVTISNNDPGAVPSVTVALSGTGVVPLASLSPAALTFGSQPVNTTSAAQAVTLSNTGGATLQIISISASANFAQTNACGAQVAPGASCVINVTFTPTAAGARTGTLTVSSDGSQLPLLVSLSGTGVSNAPTLAPTSIAFKDTNVGKISHPARTVVLTANGPGPLQILAITTTGDFSQTNNCPALLNAGSSCSISLSFTPSAAGTRTGSLNVTHNGLGSLHSVFLSGTGKQNGKGPAPVRGPKKF